MSFLSGLRTVRSLRSPRLLPNVRLYAQVPPKPRGLKPSQTPHALPGRPSSTPTPTINTQFQQNKQAMADRIFREGRHEIYKAPSHVGIIVGAWLVAASGMTCVYYYWRSGMLNSKEMVKRGLSSWVANTYLAVACFVGFLSGVFLSRSFGFVRAIKLVQDGGATKLFVTQRPWLPFWRPHRYIVQPWDLSMSRKLVPVATDPLSNKTAVGRDAVLAAEQGNKLKKIVLSPYLAMRKLFTYESVITAYIVAEKSGKADKERMVRIDADGFLSNDGKDLIALASFRD